MTACPMPGPGLLTSYVMFFLLCGRVEVIVCIIDIWGIVDPHCLNFLLMLRTCCIFTSILFSEYIKVSYCFFLECVDKYFISKCNSLFFQHCVLLVCTILWPRHNVSSVLLGFINHLLDHSIV